MFTQVANLNLRSEVGSNPVAVAVYGTNSRELILEIRHIYVAGYMTNSRELVLEIRHIYVAVSLSAYDDDDSSNLGAISIVQT